MLSPRWRKVIADLWGNKMRTALVVLSIAVGVTAVGMVASSQAILSSNITDGYAATIPPSVVFYTGAFDEELVQSVRRIEGVREAQGTQAVTVRIKTGRDEWRSLRLLAVNDFANIRINKISPQSGAPVPPDRGMLIERASLDFIGAKEGDTVIVETADGKQRNLRVAGVAHDLGKPTAFWSGTGFGYISLDTIEWLTGQRGLTSLSIAVAGNALDKSHVLAVADLVQSKIEKSDRKVMARELPDPSKHWANDAMQAMLLLMGVIAMLSLLLTGFLVVNTISSLLTQQVRQIGMMKAIGGRNRQIMGIYLAMVMVLGLLALAVGVPLGVLGAAGLSGFTSSMLNFEITRFYIPLEVLLLQAGVGLVVPLLAALYPIIAGTRTSARQAMSDYGLATARFGASFIDRLLGRVRGVSRPLLLSLRNTFRRRGRLALTLITLTLGGAIFIAVFCVQASLLLTLDDALQYWQYDIEAQFATPHRIEQIEAQALSVPGVIKAESWGSAGARRVRADQTESKNIYMVAPPASTEMLNPAVLEGRWLLSDDENALVINTEVIKEEADIRLGDEVVLKIAERETAWRVVGIIKGVLSGPIAYANRPYFNRVTRQAGLAGGVQIMTERHDRQFQSEVVRAMTQQLDSSGMRIKSTELISNIRESAVSQFNIIVAFLLVMAVLLAIVGGLGLMGTMSINVIERTREIGVMRAIGASDGSVLKVFMVEGVLIGIASWLLGTVVALPLSKLMSDAVGMAFTRQPLSYSFSQSGALLWLAVVIVLAALASFLPARSASRLTVREVLAYE